MTEASSRLTVKVRLHPAQPPEPAMPAPAPLSKFRLMLALAGFAGLAALGFQVLVPKPQQGPVTGVSQPAAHAATQNPPAQNQPAQSTVTQSTVTQSPVTQTAPAADITPATPAAADQATATRATAETVVAGQIPPGQTAADSAALPAPQHEAGSGSVAAQQPAAVASTPATVSQQPNSATADSPTTERQDAPAMVASQPAGNVAMHYPAGFSRIVLTAAMRNLEPGTPAGQQIRYPDIQRLYLFTELKGYAGQILRHRWYWQGQLHTEAVLTIEDSSWRTYSENWLLDNQRGDWRVQIVDQAEKVIFEYSFTYQ